MVPECLLLSVSDPKAKESASKPDRGFFVLHEAITDRWLAVRGGGGLCFSLVFRAADLLW